MAMAGAAGGGALGGGGLPAAPAARVERATSNINVSSYDSLTDDFEEWVELFEKAVMLATNVRDDDSLHFLYKEWLPLKLDSSARATFKQVAGRDWPDLKAQMILLLVDPQEQARWQAKKITIKWDGKESFHNLASRVKRAVDKYERGMPDDFKAREYYQRFKNAFKKPMRKVIAYGCPEGARTIEEAKAVALRYHIASTEDDDDGDGAADDAKSVVFAAGSFQPDRATGIENSLAGITTQLENISVSLRGHEVRFRSIEDRLTAVERGGSSQSRDSYQRRDSYRSRDDYRERRGNYASQSRSPRPERRNYDSYGGSSQRSNQSPYRRYEDRPRREGDQRSRGYSGDRNQRRGNEPNYSRSRDNADNRKRDRNGDRRQESGSGRSGGRGDRSSRQTARKEKESYGAEGDYRAIQTGDEQSGESDEEQYATASSMQGGEDYESYCSQGEN